MLTLVLYGACLAIGRNLIVPSGRIIGSQSRSLFPPTANINDCFDVGSYDAGQLLVELLQLCSGTICVID